MSKNHDTLDRRLWEAVRRRTLARDNMRCRNCGKYGRLEVDHILPLEDGGAPYDESNLQALCRRCHFAKTRAENLARNPQYAARAKWLDLVRDL